MKNKDKSALPQGKSYSKKIKGPNKARLNHIQNQGKKMAELLGEAQGERYIREALNEWPHLIKEELEKFKK